jgi:cytoskeletal protein CcmA (bactofilin family)
MEKEDPIMALWKEHLKGEGAKETGHGSRVPSPPEGRPRGSERGQKTDSLIAAGLTIEGKITGEGHLRIAGHFQGDVHVKGDLTVESGARVQGEVQADTVLVGGEVHGNVIARSQVQLLESGTLIGDLKAGSLTVAAGSRMRGKVEFGWDEREGGPPLLTNMDEPAP